MKYTEPSEACRNEILKLIEAAEHIAITAHFSPDDDSIASVLSLENILTQLYPGKPIDIIYTGEPVSRFSTLTHFEKIKFVPDIADKVTNYDLFIFLDGNQYGRFSRNPDALKAFPTTICIDHHSSVSDNFTLYLGPENYTATTEIIFWLFKGTYTLTSDLARIFLLGIYADTGNFTYIDEKQVRVFQAAGELVEAAHINIQELLAPFRSITDRVFLLIQELMKNSAFVTVEGWPPFQYSYGSTEYIEKGCYSDEEISAASHVYLAQYSRSISGYTWGFVITPRDNGNFRVSSRSLPKSVDVNALHTALGIGGGHVRAAGGEFKRSSELTDSSDCADFIVNWLKTHPAILV